MRIVEEFATVYDEGHKFDDWGVAGRHTLENLAAVYADHPDYRDEWRP